MSIVIPIYARLLDFIEYEASGPFMVKDTYQACKVDSLCENQNCELLKKHPEYNNRRLCPNRSKCIDNDEANIRMQLRKMADPTNPKQLLEKSTRITGCYRKINNVRVKLDIINAKEGEIFNMRFPFRLEEVIAVRPKVVGVVAGAIGSGKTAFCMNVVLLNLQNRVVHYFVNSEMTAGRIRDRLLNYEFIGGVNMSNLDVEERYDHFADGIYPDDLNVIDYISPPGTELSSVEEELKSIVSKLKTGVCIAAVQKKGNQPDQNGKVKTYDLGVGGEWTKRVPSIFITMDKYPDNHLIIGKTKERVYRHINPEGMQFKYKLVDAINFCKIQYPPEFENLPHNAQIEIGM